MRCEVEMKVAVVGSEDYEDKEDIHDTTDILPA